MTVVPALDYTSRDYDGLRSALLTYAAQAFPEWTPSSEGDFGVLMVELLAYMGDVLSYYVDRAQFEAYLPTATQLASVLNIAKLLGYKPSTGVPATGTVHLVASSGSPDIFVPKGTQLATGFLDTIDGPIIFETDVDVVVPGNPTNDPLYAGISGVPVTEGQTRQNSDGTPLLVASGTGLPDQAYQLQYPRVYENTIQIYVNDALWQPVDHLLDATASDTVYEIDIDANGYTWITFGDGVNGAMPPLGLDIEARYRTGYGAAGNLAAGAITNVYNNATLSGLALSMIDSTTSDSSETTGGADPEGIEQIRTNAPKAFASQQRAVTLTDYENFATAVPGVAKAAATASFFSSVTVYVMGPEGNTPTETLLKRVLQTLQTRTLAGVTVSVEAPVTVPVNLTDPLNVSTTQITVQAWPTYANSTVEANVTQALKDFFSFGKVSLGQRLTVSDLYYTIMGVTGVRYVAIPLMARADAAQSGTNDIQLLPNEYPTLSNLTVVVTGGIG